MLESLILNFFGYLWDNNHLPKFPLPWTSYACVVYYLLEWLFLLHSDYEIAQIIFQLHVMSLFRISRTYWMKKKRGMAMYKGQVAKSYVVFRGHDKL